MKLIGYLSLKDYRLFNEGKRAYAISADSIVTVKGVDRHFTILAHFEEDEILKVDLVNDDYPLGNCFFVVKKSNKTRK